jgi:hypothetical protein
MEGQLVKHQAVSLGGSAQAVDLAAAVVVAFAQNSAIVVCSGSHRTSRYLAVAEVAVECFQIHPRQKAHRLAEMSAQAYRHQTSHRFVVGAAAGYFVRISLFLVIVYFHQTVLPLVAVAAYFAQARRTDHQIAVEVVEAVAECFVQIILYFVAVYCRRISRRSAEAESLCQTDRSSVAMEGCQRGWTS